MRPHAFDVWVGAAGQQLERRPVGGDGLLRRYGEPVDGAAGHDELHVLDTSWLMACDGKRSLASAGCCPGEYLADLSRRGCFEPLPNRRRRRRVEVEKRQPAAT